MPFNSSLESISNMTVVETTSESILSTSSVPHEGHHVIAARNHSWIVSDSQYEFADVNNIVYASFLIPLGLLGNIFTLSAVIMVLRIKKSIPNMLIGVLATADLTSLLTCHIIALLSISNQYFTASPNLCRFQYVMMFTYFKLGFLTKTCISIDRFIALKYPLKYRLIVTTKRVIAVIVMNIIFSMGSSGLTWMVDSGSIFELETWPMCTNNFAVYTPYKLGVVVIEGTLFFAGVIMFFISNITVVRVMLKLSKNIKKLKAHESVAIGKLKLSRLAVVTTAPAFTNIGAISEENEGNESNNNDTNEASDDCDNDDAHLATPLSKRALKKLNSNELTKSTTPNNSAGYTEVETTPKLRKLSTGALNLDSYTQGVYQQKRASVPLSNGYATPGSPLSAADRQNGRKSIFKRILEKSTRPNNPNSVQSRQKKELQFAKLVMVIVTVFVILWIPFMVCTLCS